MKTSQSHQKANTYKPRAYLTKKILLWSIPMFVFGFIIAVFTSSQTSKPSSQEAQATQSNSITKETTRPSQHIVSRGNQEEAMYVASKSALLKQFFTQDAILQSDFKNTNMSNVQKIANAQSVYKYYDSLQFCLDCNSPKIPTKYEAYESDSNDEKDLAEEAVQDYYLSLEHGDQESSNHAIDIYNNIVTYMRPIRNVDGEVRFNRTTELQYLMEIPYDANNNPPSW